MNGGTPEERTPASLVDHADGDDPRRNLLAIGLLQRWLEDRELEAVRKARVEGMSWSRIADQLGRSKQAVWAKHRDVKEFAR